MGISRRQVLKGMGAVSASAVFSSRLFASQSENLVRIASVSPITIRITIAPIVDGRPVPVPDHGYLVDQLRSHQIYESWQSKPETIRSGELRIEVASGGFSVFGPNGKQVQTISFADGGVTFSSGAGPLFGLGEGGRQFDRRGDLDKMISGSVGYQLESHGSRVPIPWLIGSEGWAIFFHQPLGTYDLTGSEGRFIPIEPGGPLDLFVVASRDPKVIMAEYARLTGHPELPPLWSFGYLQSHRTLGDRESVLAEARKFREKRLPCDAMIFLGTGFCPNGWNVRNGSFEWNAKVFPDPKEMISEFHAGHFKVVPHVVIEAKTLRGSAKDDVSSNRQDPEKSASYWDMHRPDFSMGIDGW
ncbi:MAG TPA: TIM-barrel domain-containing protein [Fimbriimonas sp.]|nr:TIM-barrel domain-containing protein [Fimbriimonas sp.]